MLFWQNEAKKINLFKVRLGKGSNRRGTIAARALDYAVNASAIFARLTTVAQGFVE
jgi:hypothetical protein